MTVEAAAPAAKGRARDTRASTGGTVAAIAAVSFLFVILFLFASQIRLRLRQTPNAVAR